MLLGRNTAFDDEQMRGDPGEIERSERAEQMTAIQGSEAEGKDEVIDHARPKRSRHTKGWCIQQR